MIAVSNAPVNFFLLFRLVLGSDLPSGQRLILAIILNHLDASGEAWPSQQRIATQAGLSERAVRDHLHQLESAGWLTVIGHIGRNHIYRVSPPAETADSKRQELPDDRQEMPDSGEGNRQNLPVKPADISTQPADSSVRTGNICRLSTYEVPTKYLSTTHLQEAETGKPSQAEEVETSKLILKTREAITKTAKDPAKAEIKPSRPDWREWNRQQAGEANAVAPSSSTPQEFHAAWQGWQVYRTRRATEARIASEAIRWTREAAEAALRDCERAATTHGWPAVIARIDQAIAGDWQGINTDKIPPAPSHRPTPPTRNDSANRPGRYA